MGTVIANYKEETSYQSAGQKLVICQWVKTSFQETIERWDDFDSLK